MKQNRLLALISANQQRGKKLTIKNEGDTTHVYLYDAIGGYWGIEAESFVTRLNDIDSPNIVLHINSPGGDVFDGRAIAVAIKQHKSKITGQIDGLCASAATYVSAACDSVTMADGGFYMIHEGWTLAMGNKQDFAKTVSLLEKIDDSILNDYQRKTGLDRDQLANWMASETWFSATEAKDHGFINAILDDDTDDKEIENKSNWDLSAYANTPANLKAPKNNADDEDDLSNQKEFMARLRRQTEVLAMTTV
ncbi:MAG: Clp protease ClpP [Bermanella sp.]